VDCRDHLRRDIMSDCFIIIFSPHACGTAGSTIAAYTLAKRPLAKVHRSGFVDCSVLKLTMGGNRRRMTAE